MNVSEAAGKIGGTVVTAVSDAQSKEVSGGYASDLLSDVIANTHEGDVWITIQKHINIVAVAQLKNLAAVILVNGREPEPDTAARAEQEHVPIVTTGLPAFEAAGILYGSGIRGRRPL